MLGLKAILSAMLPKDMPQEMKDFLCEMIDMLWTGYEKQKKEYFDKITNLEKKIDLQSQLIAKFIAKDK